MAETPAADSAGDSSNIIPNMTKPSALVDYMVATYKMSEDEVSTLRVSPTAELAQKFMACAFAKAKECEKLQAMLLQYDQPTDASELICDASRMPDLTKASQVFNSVVEKLSSAPAMELAQNPLASASTTDAEKHDKLQNESELPCQLMKIPPEIRLKIYKNVFSEVLEKGPSPGMRGSYSTFHYTGGKVMCRHIKTALAMVHTSHTMRIEALPVCQQLTDTVLTSVVSELDQLRPEWRTWSIYGVAAGLERLQNKGQPNNVYERCRELEAQYDDVCEMGRALQLVNEGLHRDHDGVERCEGKA